MFGKVRHSLVRSGMNWQGTGRKTGEAIIGSGGVRWSWKLPGLVRSEAAWSAMVGRGTGRNAGVVRKGSPSSAQVVQGPVRFGRECAGKAWHGVAVYAMVSKGCAWSLSGGERAQKCAGLVSGLARWDRARCCAAGRALVL